MRPDRRRALLAPASEPDEDQTAWLLTFSDLVLQLFAFALVVAVLARVAVPAAPPAPPDPSARSDTRANAPDDAPADASRPAAAPAPPADALLPRTLVAEAFGTAGTVDTWPAVDAPAPVAPAPAEPTAAAAPADTAVPSASGAGAGADAPSAAVPPAGGREGNPDAPAVPARLAAAGRALETLATTAGGGDAVRVAVRDSDVVLTISDAIVFPSGSAELLPTARPILREVQRVASGMPDLGLEIAGHTDDVPIHTAAFPSNLELSLARAASVARELATEDPRLLARTVATGVGPYRPVASNADAAGRERNRRVEIRLVPRG